RQSRGNRHPKSKCRKEDNSGNARPIPEMRRPGGRIGDHGQ
ncbi:unnamed protein product, partial [Musa textilis]